MMFRILKRNNAADKNKHFPKIRNNIYIPQIKLKYFQKLIFTIYNKT